MKIDKERVWATDQGYHLVWVGELHDRKVKVEVRADFYQHQSVGALSVWDGFKWQVMVSRPGMSLPPAPSSTSAKAPVDGPKKEWLLDVAAQLIAEAMVVLR